MRLAVRAEAGVRVGTGHVMRCLALGQAWQDAGGAVTFVASDLPSSLRDRLRDEQMDVAGEIPNDAAWVVLDGYEFGAADQRRIKEAGLRLLWIDDYAHGAPYTADLILNQNLHAQPSQYVDRAAEARPLLGPRYALLRREFRASRRRHNEPAADARKILVTMGGSDPDKVTLKVIAALAQLSGVEVTVVAGATNPNLRALEEAVAASPSIHLEHDVRDMPSLMARADVAVSAAGSTSWELAFFGLPAVLITVAENQRPLAEHLDAAGVAVSMGWHHELEIDRLARTLSDLLADRSRRVEMAKRGRELVDGKGAARVVEEMLACSIELRPVTEADGRLLWKWVNDPGVRGFSFSSKPISWEEHQRWLGLRLADASRPMFVALDEGVPIGQIRYDVAGDAATVTVSVAPDSRGRGYASRIIRRGSERLFAATGAAVIDAYVKPENESSIRAFLKAGFTRVGLEQMHDTNAVHFTLRRSDLAP